jgi:hypothetical protein|tara:strand:+ start:79 stop:219 length:141 start_codon:yes stop_codon:yes gene_type:complete
MNKEYIINLIKETKLSFDRAEQPFEKGFYEGKINAYTELLVKELNK